MMERNHYRIILNPYMTEKASLLLSPDENKLEFIVRRNANKSEIKEAVEKIYSVKVASVNTKIRNDGKHAIVKLTKNYLAEDVASEIGMF